MSFTLTSGAATAVGRRDHNEDGYVVSPRVLAVADGMGGHAAGEVASGLVVDALTRLGELPTLESEDVVGAIRRVNDELFVRARGREGTARMGTTLTGVAMVRSDATETLLVFNVGDSRTYLLRDDQLTQLTRDHSLVQELVDGGTIDSEQARTHPQRNVVTRVLGATTDVDIDAIVVDLLQGDRLLICSDGVTSGLRDPELLEFLRNAPPNRSAENLVAQALAAGSNDNATAVVVDVDFEDSREPLGDELDDTQPPGVVPPVAPGEPPMQAAEAPDPQFAVEIESIPWDVSELDRRPT